MSSAAGILTAAGGADKIDGDEQSTMKQGLAEDACLLRAAASADLGALSDILALPQVALGYFGAALGPRDIREVLEDNWRWEARGEARQWIAYGDVGVFGYGAIICGKLAYFMHPAHWRQGHGRRLLRQACEHAFAHHPGATLVASIFRDNCASVRLLEGLGGRFRGLTEAQIIGQRLPTPMLRYELDAAGFRLALANSGSEFGVKS